VDKYSEVTYVVVWAIVLWGLCVAKVVSEGVQSYFSHYTNWNWTINVIYFTGDLVTRFSKDKMVRITYLGSLFWLVYGSNWSVFFLVFLMFSENPGVLTDLATQNGGKYGMGFLLNMNTVFHSLPLIAVLIYVVLAKSELAYVIKEMVSRLKNTNYVVFSFLIAFLFPILAITIYSLCVDFHKVYGMTTNIGYIILIVLGVVLIFNGTTMLFLYAKAARREYKLAILERKERKRRSDNADEYGGTKELD
jgi:hypothetical protein